MDKVIHFEIPADDLYRAQRFYKECFGWEIQKGSIPDAPEYYMLYTAEIDKKGMPKKPGSINGGMYKRQAPGETPVIWINVESLDEALKKIESAGGKIVMPRMQVGDMGLAARVCDTEGNVIGIWQSLK